MYKLGKDIIAILMHCSTLIVIIFFQYRLSVTNAKGGIIQAALKNLQRVQFRMK